MKNSNYNWHSMNLEEIFNTLKTDAMGLSQESVQKRLSKFGKNEFPKSKGNTFLKIFLTQMTEPMDILLFIAMIFSFIIHENIDGFAILFIIMIDLILGTFQEWKANRTAESLANLIKVHTKVRRDGKEVEIDASNLVIGDIVLLEPGNKISADLRILECSNLQIDESVLTGESVSVYKTDKIYNGEVSLAERKNMAYAGTSVLTGRARAVVVTTGINTEVGKIANKVINTKETQTPLTIRMEKFTKQISLLVLIVAILITAILIYKRTPYSEIFLSVIALSISAMPEGLALALTMALTIASNRMGKQNVITKKLNAAESLGSCTVIASDKTGTLTVNEQTAKKIVLPDESSYFIDGSGYNDVGQVICDRTTLIENAYFISKLGVLNNEASFEKEGTSYKVFGDSIDIAFLALGKKLNVDTNGTKILDIIPYEPEKKYSAVFYSENDEHHCTMKGSLEVVLDACADALVGKKKMPLDKKTIIAQNDSLAKDGYRIIAIADKKLKKKDDYDESDIKDLHFIGLVAFIDPIRKEVLESIEECKQAHIKVIMITGDYPLTGFSIGKELGICSSYDEIATGLEIDEYLKKGQKAFDKFIKSKLIFTRVTPLNKLEIVESLKRNGEFTCVTGDGVNDAPAIRSANIGVAMGSGTDVAKDTASLIILDDNFKSIVTGIKEGRVAYSNIRKVSYMLLSCGVAEVLFFVLSILTDLPMPLVAIQLLWLNIVTDGLQDIALSCEKEEEGIMSEPPRNPKESIFNKNLFREVMIAGLSIGLIVFVVWIVLIKKIGMDISLARGYIMILMVFMQNVHVLNCRSEKKSFYKIPLKTNPLVAFTIIGSIILQIIVSEVPLFSNILQVSSVPLKHMPVLLLLSTIILFIMELYKKYIVRKD